MHKISGYQNKSAQNLGVKWRNDALSQRSTRILEVILPNLGSYLTEFFTRLTIKRRHDALDLLRFCLYTVSISGWRFLAGDGWRFLAGDGLEKREPRLNVAAISDFGSGSRGNNYPQVIVDLSPQNRLSFRLRLSSMTALSSASRFSCAGVVYHPPAPPYVAKSIQSPPKNAASIGIPCTMLFDDASLSLLQRYDWLKVIDYSSYSKKEHPTLMLVKVENSKFAKMLGEIGLDVLF